MMKGSKVSSKFRQGQNIKYQISNIKYQISNIKYQISNIKYQISIVYCLLLKDILYDFTFRCRHIKSH
jgi:hypothetical protein